MKFLFDCSGTSHCAAHTGIQRVARSFYANIQQDFKWLSIVFDPYSKRWREIRGAELSLMDFSSTDVPKEKRSKRWSITDRLQGYLDFLKANDFHIKAGDWYFTSEIFDEKRFQEIEKLQSLGVKTAAVFHDGIPLILPQFTPKKTVVRFRSYLCELASFDKVFAVSNDSREMLINYWFENGINSNCEVVHVPLAVDFDSYEFSDPDSVASLTPNILTVGSLEGRKNHLELFNAAELLWGKGYQFSLHVVGMLNSETGQKAADKLKQLIDQRYPISWHRNVSDVELLSFYQKCDFTVYPSMYEGFGLPVLESLYYQKPCVCLGNGATGEIAKLGGCLEVKAVNVKDLAEGISKLLDSSNLLHELKKECTSITFRTWASYKSDIENRLLASSF